MTSATPLNIREIVFASDFSRHSDHAFRAALALARHFEARLRLLHVVHHAQEQEATRARLAAFGEQRAVGVAFTVAVAVGNPVSEIVKYADEQGANLVVMGTHGRTGLAHALLGSVAEGVVRHAGCQVLTIPWRAAVPEEPSREQPAQASREPRCFVCGRVSDDHVCYSCKARIQAEAIYLRSQDEKGKSKGSA